MGWSYKRDESRQFSIIPEGEYRIRIAAVDKAVSKNGRDMLSLQFDVSGQAGKLFHYIVFLEDKPEITNRNLTQFFDSFKDIKEGDLDNLQSWVGKVGACKVKHEPYGDNVSAKIHYFIAADKQDGLAPWKEPERKSKDIPADDDGFVKVMEEDIPF
jgi:hypothetical protein